MKTRTITRASSMVGIRSAMIGLALSTLVLSRPALADDVTGAANAFSRAQKAELGGDYASAAELYELADSLAPAPEALRSALRARKAAGQLEVAAVHAEELLDRYPNDAKSTELANSTIDEAGKKLMRYEVECHPSACTLLLDGAAASPDAKEKHVLYLTPGKHEVIAAFGKNRAEPQSTEGAAGNRGALSFEAPPEPPARVDTSAGVDSASALVGGDQGVSRQHGLSPWFFVGGAVATVGLGAATVWSGLDVLSANDTYKKHPTTAAYNDGKDRELRTNVLIAATSVVGAATGVIALFTNWSGSKGGESAERPGTVHATAAVSGSSAALVVSGVY